ncbi:MAG: ABC transporter ATP-binding protein/permease [Eubacterium sp.]|nr:ABC transporter ATP-binding protein/permease [Eubacterium sp.]
MQKHHTGDGREQKLTAKEILKEQWFLTRFCFAAAPGGMAFHVFESVKLQVSIFFEFIWMINYALGIAERGGPWKQFFWCMVIFMAAVFVSTMSFSYYKQSVKPRLTPVLHQAFRMHIYERTKDLDLACYDETDFYQKFILAAEESDTCIDRYLETVETYSAGITQFVLALGFCLTVNPLILLVTGVSFCVSLWLAGKENRLQIASRMERLPYEQKREYQNRVFYLSDYAKDLRLYPGMQQKCRQDFNRSQKEIRRIHRTYGKKLFVYGCIRDAVGPVYLESVLSWSLLLYQVLKLHTLSYAAMLSSLKAASYVSKSSGSMIMGWKKAAENAAYVKRIHSLTNMEPSVVSAKNLPVGTSPVSFDIRHVTFSYQPGKPVLKDISLQIGARQKIALVGYNGSGKTTLVKLLLRLYDPDSGSICCNGTDIRDYAVEGYRHSIGSVFQDFKIYAASLKENVLMDVSQNTKKENYEVEKALYDAHFTLQDNRLVYQIETPLTTEFEKDGVNLSGGEMQKVAIARTLYRRQNLIIMDEPSSALDPRAEYELNQELNEIAQDKTVVFISHRLSTTRDADCIYMMEQGRIIEAGTHEELLAAGGKYAGMWKVQAGLYLDAQ